ncbi:MAG: hypothetical protein KME43_25345 [Myxacorys chilensis ATA2-1-KO14]|nr:hypothetical protein [Myxacorys chilensis ATA2-1-KO14]
MKITRQLKQQIAFIAFQIAIGQLSSREAIAAALRTFLGELEAQSDAKT